MCDISHNILKQLLHKGVRERVSLSTSAGLVSCRRIAGGWPCTSRSERSSSFRENRPAVLAVCKSGLSCDKRNSKALNRSNRSKGHMCEHTLDYIIFVVNPTDRRVQ